MRLRNITLDDLALYEAQNDPAMMAHLGGPVPSEGLAEKLARDVESVADGSAWILVIVPDDDHDAAAGSVVIWESEWRGEPVNEIGWMVLPPYQGRGLATRAVREMLDRARAQGRWGVVHAFPPTSNDRSNAMCARLGFELRDEDVAIEWRGRTLHANHWALDLRGDR